MKKKQRLITAALGMTLLCSAVGPTAAARFTMTAPGGQLSIDDGQTVILYIQNDASLGTTPPNGYGIELVGLTLPSNVTLLSAMPTPAAPQTSIQVRYAGHGAQDIGYDIREIPYRDEYYALWTGVDATYAPLATGSTDSNWTANDPLRIADGLPVTLLAPASGPALVIDSSNCTSIITWLPSGKALTSPGSPEPINKCTHTPLHWQAIPTNITFNRTGGINITTTPDLFNWTYSRIADDVLSISVNGGAPFTLGATTNLTGASLGLNLGANATNAIVGDTGWVISMFQIVPNLTDEGDGVAAPNDMCPDTPAGQDSLGTGNYNGCGSYLFATHPQLSFKLNGPAAPVPVNGLPMLVLLSGLLLAAAGLFKRFSSSAPKAQ